MSTYPHWYIPEWVQPMSNSRPSCPWCEGYEEHYDYCGRAEFVAEYKRLVAIADVAGYALTDFVYEHGSDFDPIEWPGMAALRAALPEPVR